MSYQFIFFHTCDMSPHPSQPTKYIEACVKLHMYNAEDLFELLKSHDKELMLNHCINLEGKHPSRSSGS
jgi:hypothetical protein